MSGQREDEDRPVSFAGKDPKRGAHLVAGKDEEQFPGANDPDPTADLAATSPTDNAPTASAVQKPAKKPAVVKSALALRP